MEIRSRLLRWNLHLLKITERTHPPYAQNSNALKKCRRDALTEGLSFLYGNTHYFGHIIRPRLFEVASNMTNTIRGLKAPANLTRLSSFLGLRDVFGCLYAQLRKISGTYKQELTEGPTVVISNDKWRRTTVCTVDKELAYIAVCPRASQFSQPPNTWYRRLRRTNCLRSPTRATWKNGEFDRILVKFAHWCLTPIWHHAKRVHCYRVGRTSITPVLRQYQIHCRDWTWLSNIDPESYGYHRKTRTLAC